MFEKQKLRLASMLYKFAFPLYRMLYFNFKKKKDGNYLLLLNRFLRHGSIVLDIGANIGFYSKSISEIVGQTGRVYSFEPDRTNFRHLKNELKNRSNVTLINKAVAAETGSITLYTSTLLNVDHRTYKPNNFSKQYSVEKTSVDDFVNRKFNVDFIKMDIQGFEMEALKGMEQTLKTNRDIFLFMELWPWGLKQAGSTVAEVFDFISELEFKIYKVNPAELSLLSREEAINIDIDFFTDINIVASRTDLINMNY